MNYNENTQKLLIEHCKNYPALTVWDVFKFLHQSSFGCEHMVTSEKSATESIKEELAFVGSGRKEALVEPLDGDYGRVSLAYVAKGLSAQTLGRLFYLSAKQEKDGCNKLSGKIRIAEELAEKGLLPFSRSEFSDALLQWKDTGFSSVHHSDVYKREYSPAYRVISNEFVPFLPLFLKIDSLLSVGRLTLAVDGGSASGKTTLGKMLREIYGCTVFHTDDFFLRPEQRTEERLSQTGGNFDRERFIEEVLVPLSKNETVKYRRYDCSTGTLSSPVEVNPERLCIIEGAYSMHPEAEKYYDFSVFLSVTDDIQRERILKRNTPQTAERFFGEWIPMEKKYFNETNIEKRCSMTIKIDE